MFELLACSVELPCFTKHKENKPHACERIRRLFKPVTFRSVSALAGSVQRVCGGFPCNLDRDGRVAERASLFLDNDTIMRNKDYVSCDTRTMKPNDKLPTATQRSREVLTFSVGR